MIKEGIAVSNAGLVILASYFPMLLERLGLATQGAFVSAEAQKNAVHYLQFVSTGMSHTEEVHLPLTKVLAGMYPSQAVEDGIDITESEIALIEGMIHTITTQHWQSIGETSIQGVRGNWLVRDGILSEESERWELVVEKRPYDLLLNRSPFSFSIVKNPWMDKPLHVQWEY